MLQKRDILGHFWNIAGLRRFTAEMGREGKRPGRAPRLKRGANCPREEIPLVGVSKNWL